MEPVLLAIGGLGVFGLAGVLLLARRISRVQVELARLDTLEELSRRLHDLSAEFERKELNTQLKAKMTEFTEADRRLAHALTEVKTELQELKELHQSSGRRGDTDSGGEPQDVAEIVRSHLKGRGFAEIQILSDLTSLQGRNGRVVFEARLEGVMHKGHVNLQNGKVVDENVRAAYSAFP